MRKKLPILIAPLCGVLGFALRRWQLSAGFEADTGLPIPGAPSALALLLLSAATVCLLIVLVQPFRRDATAEETFAGARGNTVYLTAVVLAGFLLAVAAALEFYYRSTGQAPKVPVSNWISRVAASFLPPLRDIVSLLGLPSALLWGRAVYRGESLREKASLLVLCLLFCLWLITAYQARAADPILMDYLYEILSLVFTLLGLYCIAGYSFLECKPRRTLFFCLMADYFILVTLADAHTLAELARWGFALLFLTAHAFWILHPSAAPAGEETADDPGEQTEAE